MKARGGGWLDLFLSYNRNMTKVEFYFDPACPFSWITSRWLHIAAGERDVEVAWLPFSLAIKNDVLESGDGEHDAKQRAAHRLLRVMLAASKQYGADLGELYTTAGIQIHVGEEAIDDDLIKYVLQQHSLPEALLQAADDTSLDQTLQGSIADATTIVGQDVGVPLIIFELADSQKQGYFGPVLNELPEKPEALELWDALSKLATSKSFYELKRSRPDGGPDVISTAKC